LPIKITKIEDREEFLKARVCCGLGIKRKLRAIFGETVDVPDLSYSSSDSDAVPETETKKSLRMGNVNPFYQEVLSKQQSLYGGKSNH
jgi:hypothetical protein